MEDWTWHDGVTEPIDQLTDEQLQVILVLLDALHEYDIPWDAVHCQPTIHRRSFEEWGKTPYIEHPSYDAIRNEIARRIDL